MDGLEQEAHCLVGGMPAGPVRGRTQIVLVGVGHTVVVVCSAIVARIGVVARNGVVARIGVAARNGVVGLGGNVVVHLVTHLLLQ